MTFQQLRETARKKLARGAGNAREIYQQVMTEGRSAPETTGLSQASVTAWRSHFEFGLPEVGVVVEEEGPLGKTAKATLKTHDGLEMECVLIPMGRGRHTLCVSSQVGCKMGCNFCETGRMGLIRNLSADEIVSQVLAARHRLGWPVRNIVFMGMGEALDNADAVIQAIRVFNDPPGLAIGLERITVSTVGRVDGIARLTAEGLKRINLSVSLNAANDTLRNRLMPINRKTPLKVLQTALVAYRPRRNFTLGIGYCLMPGLNDSRQDAADVAAFCQPIARKLINVIGYNPGHHPLTRAPTDDEILQFVGWLREEGLSVRIRFTKGRSVMAACGQLGNVEKRREMRDAVRDRKRGLTVST